MMKLRFFVIYGLLIQSALWACDVPVFRYALERWERDLYRVFIVHDGNMNEVENTLSQTLKGAGLTQMGQANFMVYDVDMSDAKVKESFYKSFKDIKNLETKTPQIILRFPYKGTFPKDVVWQGELTQENVDELLSSKATAELMKGVLQGYSSTFLLMESGDETKDKKTVETITKAIAKFEQELEIPKGVVQTDGEVTGGELTPFEAARRDPSNVLKSGIPLKIDFHLMRMPKNDGNAIFRAILDKTHDSSENQNEPKLYAFFGRGRLLGPMVGDDINLENLTMLAEYLCGACSCQMKRENPGIDFLTNLDWMSFLEGSEVVVDKTLPPLIGVIDMALKPEPVKDIPESIQAEEPLTDNGNPNSTLSKNISVTIGLVLALIIGGTFIVRKK